MVLTVVGWGLFVAAVFCLVKAKALPLSARIWLKRVGKETVEKYIKEAQEMVPGTTGDVKRWFVVGEIKDYVNEKLGTTISDSDCNLVIEYVYSKIKNAKTNISLLQRAKDMVVALYNIIKFRA